MAAKKNPFLQYLDSGDPERLPKKPPGPGQRAIDIPTFNWFTWDTLQIVTQAINNLDFGIMREAALLWDWMLRDDRMSAALNKRIEGLLGLPMDFDPPDETKKAARIADDLEAIFPKSFPKAALYDLLRWGDGLGVGLAQLVYDKQRDGSYLERLQPWHPQFLYWDWTRRLFYVVTQNKGNVYVEPNDPKWFLYTPYGMQLGWTKSLIRALFTPWLVRQFALRDWGRFSEIHGKPIRKAIFPSEASQEEKNDFFMALTYISSEMLLRLPQSADGKTKYDLELLEAKSESWQGIKELKKDMDDCISITLLGNNLTTDQKQGSLAATKQHAQQQSIFVKSMGENLSSFLNDGPIKYWAAWNYAGGAAFAPKQSWQTDPPEDLVEKSQVTLQAAQALQILKTIMAPIDERKYLEGFSIELLEPGAPVPEMPMAQNTAPPTDEPEDETEPGSGAVLRGMVRALSLERQESRQVRGQRYVDRVADVGTVAGADALRRDLNAILSDIRESQSPSELRHRLRARYRGMDPVAFSKVVHGALMLSNLAGRGAS